MTRTARMVLSLCALLVPALGAGCSWSSGHDVEAQGLGAGTPLPRRHGTVVIDGCILDTWQSSALASPGMRSIVQEVIMLCLAPQIDGTIVPRDPSARAFIASNSATLRGLGYKFDLAISFVDETGARYDGNQTAMWIADPAFRGTLKTTLLDELGAVGTVDGIELDLEKLPDAATASVTALAAELAPALRPGRTLGIFVPPSIAEPSDIPGGNAFSRLQLAPLVDRMHVSTLDFSAPQPGPTIDPGWAVDAARLAKTEAPSIDVAYPLYGTDFGPHGTRFVSFLEATALAATTGNPINRGPTGAPNFAYTNEQHELHLTWFDDAESTGRGLAAWTFDVLPPDVGVVYWGLGAEDPALWDRLASRTP